MDARQLRRALVHVAVLEPSAAKAGAASKQERARREPQRACGAC
jgi:hypothetical protein